MEHVEKLSLVFVKALDLCIKDAFRIKEFVLCVLEVFGKLFLVVALDFNEFVDGSFIVDKLFKALELVKFLYPAVTDSLCNECCKFRV